MRTEHLRKCFIPLQKLGAKLSTRLTDLSPPPPPCKFQITDRSKAVLLMWLSILFVLVSVSVLLSPSMYLDDI